MFRISSVPDSHPKKSGPAGVPKHAGDRYARIINMPGLILKAIQDGVLSISEADALKAELEKNRFNFDRAVRHFDAAL
jgi:hypothetical protein